MRRFARAAVVVVVSLIALYLVGVNVILSTSLFERIVNGDPNAMDIHLTRAWMVVPGHVHANGLSIRGRDSNVEWILTLEDVDFDLALLPLRQRRFQVTRAHGNGIAMRVRQRLDAAPRDASEVADLPPIPGFPPYSVRPAPTPADELERWSDEHWKLWTIELANVDAEHVREIWFDRMRFAGDARIGGGFYLKPIRSVVVGPVDVSLHDGTIFVGPHAVAEDLAGTVRAKVDAFDPRSVHGTQLLQRVSVDTDARARCSEIGELVTVLRPLVPLQEEAGQIDSATGVLELSRVALHFEHGALREDSHLVAAVDDLMLESGRDVLRMTIALRGDTSMVEGRDTLTLRADVTKSSLTTNGRLVSTVPRLEVTATSAELGAKQPLVDLRVRASADEMDLRDVTALHRLAPMPSVRWLGGRIRGRAAIDVSIAERRMSAEAAVEAEGLDVRVGPIRTRGNFGIRASTPAWKWAEQRVLDASLVIRSPRASLLTKTFVVEGAMRVAARARDTDLRAGKVVIGDLDVDLVDIAGRRPNSSASFFTLGRAHVAAKSTRAPGEGHAAAASFAEPISFLQWLSKSAVYEVTLDDGVLSDARPLQTLVPTGGAVTFERGFARASARLVCRRLGGESRATTTGRVDVVFDAAAVRLQETPVSGRFAVRAEITGVDPERGAIGLSGSKVTMTDIAMTGASTEVENWSGEVALRNATLRLSSDGPALDTTIAVDARDARPVLVLVFGPSLPSILVSLTDMPRLEGSARLAVRSSDLSLSRIDVRGGDLALRGLYAARGRQSRGAFIVEKGPFSAGVRVTQAETMVRLFGLDKWLDHEASVIRDVTSPASSSP